VKDKIDSREVELQYYPTEEMLGDYFTKVLQGKQIFKLRKLVMAKSDV
jgi:hypothetical protein